MTQNRILKCIIFIVTITLLVGCTGNSPVTSLNRGLKQDKYPMRYVKDKTYTKGTKYIEGFAGKKGVSITEKSPQVKKDVYKTIYKHCHYTAKDRVYVNIVENNVPYYYEVWIFKDKQSKRKDKLSALSVILHQLPNKGGVDILLKGKCHATQGMVLTFAD